MHDALLHQRTTPVENAPVVKVREVRGGEDLRAREGRLAVVLLVCAIGTVTTSAAGRKTADEAGRGRELHKLDGVDSFSATPIGSERPEAFDHLLANVD